MIRVRLPASSGWKTVGSRLRVEVPVKSAPKSSAAKKMPTRVASPEQRDGDPMKPICDALDDGQVEVELPAEDVDPAGEPGEGAGDRHRQEVVPRDADAAVAGRVGVEADRAHLVAERRPGEDQPVDDERADRDEEADVQPLERRVAPEDVELRALRNGRS